MYYIFPQYKKQKYSKVPEGSRKCLQGLTTKDGKIPTAPPSGGGQATSLDG
jgi:hypothetical protein